MSYLNTNGTANPKKVNFRLFHDYKFSPVLLILVIIIMIGLGTDATIHLHSDREKSERRTWAEANQRLSLQQNHILLKRQPRLLMQCIIAV